MTWRNYPSTKRAEKKHDAPPFTTAKQRAIEDSLDAVTKDELHAAAEAYAVAVMARFERDRGRR